MRVVADGVYRKAGIFCLFVAMAVVVFRAMLLVQEVDTAVVVNKIRDVCMHLVGGNLGRDSLRLNVSECFLFFNRLNF